MQCPGGIPSSFLQGGIASLQHLSEQFPNSVFSSPGTCASSSWSQVWWQPCVVQQAPRALGLQGTNPMGVEHERMAGLMLVPSVQLLLTAGLIPGHASDEIQPRNEHKGVTSTCFAGNHSSGAAAHERMGFQSL